MLDFCKESRQKKTAYFKTLYQLEKPPTHLPLIAIQQSCKMKEHDENKHDVEKEETNDALLHTQYIHTYYTRVFSGGVQPKKNCPPCFSISSSYILSTDSDFFHLNNSREEKIMALVVNPISVEGEGVFFPLRENCNCDP